MGAFGVTDRGLEAHTAGKQQKRYGQGEDASDSFHGVLLPFQ